MTVESLAENTWKDGCRKDQKDPQSELNWGPCSTRVTRLHRLHCKQLSKFTWLFSPCVCLFSYHVPDWFRLAKQQFVLKISTSADSAGPFMVPKAWSLVILLFRRHHNIRTWYGPIAGTLFHDIACLQSSPDTSYSFWLYHFPLVVNWQNVLSWILVATISECFSN